MHWEVNVEWKYECDHIDCMWTFQCMQFDVHLPHPFKVFCESVGYPQLRLYPPIHVC